MNKDRYEGKECIYGHGRIRYKKSHTCVECKRLSNRTRNDADGRKQKLDHGAEQYYERWNADDINFATAKHKDGSYLWTAEETAEALNRTHGSIKCIRRTKPTTKEPEQMKNTDKNKNNMYSDLCDLLKEDYPLINESTKDNPERGPSLHKKKDMVDIYKKRLGTDLVSIHYMCMAYDHIGLKPIVIASNQSKSKEIQELRDTIIRLELALLHLSKDTNKEDRVRDLLTSDKE